MKYEIRITRAAERDLSSAADYIEHVLLRPQAANDLLDKTASKLGELASFPEKSALVDDPILKAWGIRFTIVNHYLAFYVIDKEENRIYIVRFLYGKRDWTSILKQGFSLD